MLKRSQFILLLLLLFSSLQLFGQDEIIIFGQVFDKSDAKPLSGVSVSFTGTNVETRTNEEGYYVLRSNNKPSSLTVSFFGYETMTVKLRTNESYNLDIELKEIVPELPLLLVVPGENKAIRFMEKVRNARQKNNPANAPQFSFLVQEKTNGAISKVDKRTFNNRIFKDLQKGLVSMDDSTVLLPLFYSNKTFLQSLNNKTLLQQNEKSLIQVDQNQMESIVNNLPIELNFYENYLSLFGKQFVSPLGNNGGSVYNYFFKDSSNISSGKIYTVQFYPKNKKQLAFEGTVQIDSASLALMQVSCKIPKSINLNFVSGLSITQDFRLLDGKWIFSKQKTISYLKWTQNEKNKSSLFLSRESFFQANKSDTIISITPTVPDSTERIYRRSLDSTSNTPVIKAANSIADVLINKYIHLWKFDIGEINRFLAYNNQEGVRYNFGMRTGKKFNNHFSLGAYAGWGTKDEAWKYGGQLLFRFPQSNYSVLGLKYANDMFQTEFNYHDQIRQENYLGNGLGDFSTFLFRNNNSLYNNRKLAELFWDYNWTAGYKTHFSVTSCNYYPNNYLPYKSGTTTISVINDYSFTLDMRISQDEKVLDSYFHRIYLSNYHPVTHFVFTAGKFEAQNQGDFYLKLHSMTTRTLPLGSYGKLRYTFEAGYLFGKAPFPLLEIMSGYENNGLARYSVHPEENLFVADTYASIQTNLITNGIIFNQIPFINKLNLRESLGFRMLYGTLQEKNAQLIDIPSELSTFDKPYFQFSAGIANLFRILALEYVWGFPQTKSPNSNWGVQCRMSVDF